MAEDDNKKIQTDSSSDKPANPQVSQANAQKRRPGNRNRKPKNNQSTEEVFKLNQQVQPAQPKKKRRRRPRKKPQEVQVQPSPEKETLEDIFMDETQFAPPEPALNEEAKEEKFLASDDNKQEPAVEPAQPLPSTPAEEISQDVAQDIPPAAPAQEGPVGWNQLKEAIKKDYEETKDEVPSVVPVAPPEAEFSESEPESEPEVQEETVIPEEVVEPVSVSTKNEELGADEDAEKKEIIKIITKYALGGCLIIVVIAGIFLFKLPQRIIGLFQGSSDGVVVQEQVIETIDQQETVQTPSDSEDFEEGVGTAIVTGESIPRIKRASSAIQAVYVIGLPKLIGSDEDVIATYMNTLSKLQNAFATDIHQLLDNSSNRAQALQIHLSELNVALDQAKDDYDELSTKRDTLKELFNETTTAKNQLEEEFFTATENLRNQEANKLLVDFIDASTRQVDLKAQYNALSKLKELYETAIANMEARIKDIELNKSALISGVKVVDIKGSDLELIIQEGEL
jgi:hypothetical protein